MTNRDRFENESGYTQRRRIPTADEVFRSDPPAPPASALALPAIASQDGVILIGRIQMTPIGLHIPDDVSEGEWIAFNTTLEDIKTNVNKSMQWIRADQIAFAVTHLGATYDDMARGFDLKPKTAEIYAAVGKNVGQFSRLNAPSFSHACEVAWLDEDAQRYWIKRANDESLSVAQLRALIKGEKLRAKRGKKKRAENPLKTVQRTLTTLSKNASTEHRVQLATWLRDMADRIEAGE